MFNLLVSSNPEAWSGAPYVFSAARVINEYEHTSKELAERFGDQSDASLNALAEFPSVFAYENGISAPARLGWITRARKRGGEVRVEYFIEDGIPAITHEDIMSLKWELDIDDWELNRTHWAVKEAEIYKELQDAAIIKSGSFPQSARKSNLNSHLKNSQTRIYVTPTVFRVPNDSVNPSLVAIMMPFSSNFRNVYQALRKACENLRADCQRADEVWEENEVMQDIFSLIYRSKVVICDFSERNPNVFYEAGIAHTLGRHVIPILQNSNDWPFDLQHQRYLQYTNNEQGLSELTTRIQPRLRRLLLQD